MKETNFDYIYRLIYMRASTLNLNFKFDILARTYIFRIWNLVYFINLVPQHIIIRKSEFIVDDIDTLSEDAVEEYNTLENFIVQHIDTERTTDISLSELNLKRNRYKDMVPFDSNIVFLSTPTGQPPSDYINASWVTLIRETIMF